MYFIYKCACTHEIITKKIHVCVYSQIFTNTMQSYMYMYICKYNEDKITCIVHVSKIDKKLNVEIKQH